MYVRISPSIAGNTIPMAANPSNPLPHSPTCPFCVIASAHPPSPPSALPPGGKVTAPGGKISDLPQTHLILSTRHVLAFLDIMPLTRGHLLVTSRGHYERLGQVGIEVGSEVCCDLPFPRLLLKKKFFSPFPKGQLRYG
jgi:hypothetical protein